jgi:uncharacterized protein YhfF
MGENSSLPAEFVALPKAEFAFPGRLRDQLVGAILDGRKTTTTGLLIEYEREGSAVPEAGDRCVVVDSRDQPVAVIELTEVRVAPLGTVDLVHCVDEGEGHRTVEEWRRAHEDFWHGPDVRAELGSGFSVDDETPVVMERFRLIRRLT